MGAKPPMNVRGNLGALPQTPRFRAEYQHLKRMKKIKAGITVGLSHVISVLDHHVAHGSLLSVAHSSSGDIANLCIYFDTSKPFYIFTATDNFF